MTQDELEKDVIAAIGVGKTELSTITAATHTPERVVDRAPATAQARGQGQVRGQALVLGRSGHLEGRMSGIIEQRLHPERVSNERLKQVWSAAYEGYTERWDQEALEEMADVGEEICSALEELLEIRAKCEALP